MLLQRQNGSKLNKNTHKIKMRKIVTQKANLLKLPLFTVDSWYTETRTTELQPAQINRIETSQNINLT